ncbi:MAG: hypothetical protein N2169_08025, partial [bacterium]|nr:hypothetical protein [bacterium]
SDSSESYTFFNLAKWNGKEWTLYRLYYQNNIQHLRWILAFNENDIWVNTILRWNGIQWQELSFDQIFYGVRTNKAWGTSSKDFYVVGDNGFVAHFDGVRWRRIESGTTLPIYDIWGCKVKDKQIIICTAGYVYTAGEKKILRINENFSIDNIQWDSNYRAHSVWFNKELTIFVSGDGIWQRKLSRWVQFEGLPRYFMDRIRGNSINDIIVVGNFGLVTHYNGYNWRVYDEVSQADIYFSVDYKNNQFIAVGFLGSRATVLR